MVDPLTQLMREGGDDQRFGIILEGEVELSIAGRVVSTLGAGESFGETAYLDEVEHRQHASVVTLSLTRYLEISPAALSLASEECMEHFRQRLISTVARRLARSEAQIAASGVAASRPTNVTSIGLQLLDT
jgi:eukaryotic-like serine/threonine-protein kinase